MALSSTEAEYMAMAFAGDESVLINVDNQGPMKLAINPIFHNRTKHIDIRYHNICEVVSNSEVTLQYCSTNEIVADILTKNLFCIL